METPLKRLLKQFIWIAPYTGSDRAGNPSFGSPVRYPARIESKSTLVDTLQGIQRVRQDIIYLDGNASVVEQDRVILPSGFHPRSPNIKQVLRPPDENGPNYYVEVII